MMAAHPIVPDRRETVKSLMLNLVATGLYVLLGIILTKVLGLSEPFSLITVAAFVVVGGSLLILILSTNALSTITSPYAAIVLSLLILSIALNVYFVVKPFANTTVSIGALQPTVFNFGGDYDDNPDSAGYGAFNVHYLSDGNAEYSVSYGLPNDKGNVWAGLSFRFKEKQDFTKFKTLNLKIVFGDPQIGGDSDSNSYLAIISNGKKSTVNLRNARGVGTQNERTVTIDLHEDFRDIDLSSVEEISFNTDGNFPRGNHTYNISYIELSQ